jgi:hypothetical protein
MKEAAKFFSDNLNLKVLHVNFSPNVIKFGAIILLLFILVLTLARVRRHFMDWSFKGALFGIFFGFLLALILEGFLIIGGRTAITEVLGWKNAPQPIQVALDSGKSQLIRILGIKDEIPSSTAKENITVQGAIETLQSLNPTDMKKVKTLICQP